MDTKSNMIENEYNTADLPKWSDAKLKANIEVSEKDQGGDYAGLNADFLDGLLCEEDRRKSDTYPSSLDSIGWLDESYAERVAKECNMSLIYDGYGGYYDANVEALVKFAQEIAKAAIQSNKAR
tara:strand:- start:53 stop:424 length:372 start_codon:yes stop_codon:yes gene_type:complete